MTDVDIAADRVAHREIDIALVPTGLQHKALALAPLGRDELVAAISPSNPLAAKERVLAVDLKEQRFIMPSSGNLRFVPWDRFLINSGLFPRIIVETDDLELAKHLAGQNVGITIVPRWSVNGELARGECAVLPIGPHGLYRDWYLAYHNANKLAGPARSFLRVCIEELPRLFANGARPGAPESPNDAAKAPAEKPEPRGVPPLLGLDESQIQFYDFDKLSMGGCAIAVKAIMRLV